MPNKPRGTIAIFNIKVYIFKVLKMKSVRSYAKIVV